MGLANSGTNREAMTSAKQHEKSRMSLGFENLGEGSADEDEAVKFA